jgi:2-hydroxyglutarate dehydrogenase
MGSEPPSQCDTAVVGGGILGVATARELLLREPGRSVVVLEREGELALHQTGRSSGVIHAGVYYAPGSLKARLCVEGARELYDYCEQRGIRAIRCGKVIVAANESELPRLDELERRGRANGVPGLTRIDDAELREIEPAARGLAALHSPATGVVDFAAVTRALAREVEEMGGQVIRGVRVEALREVGPGVRVEHRAGALTATSAVACAGLASDRLAVASGGPADPRIVPFRGAYLRVRPERAGLVRGLIYPVPDPDLPFLGVHLSRMHDGQVVIGPTALMRPAAAALRWPGTWRLARRWWRTGATEIGHALSRRAMARAAARYVPGIARADLERAWSGIRAQAVARDGSLLDDFAVSQSERTLHVRNAPSPAATSALALARLIADRLEAGPG